jgi:ribonuclease HI
MFTEIYFDGAADPNPGIAGAGTYIKATGTGYMLGLGTATNNEAEWEALILGLQQAQAQGYKEILAVGDSQLVLHCAFGVWTPQKPHLRVLRDRSNLLLASFDRAEFIWVKRNYNTTADRLSKAAQKLKKRQLVEQKGLAFTDPEYSQATKDYQIDCATKNIPQSSNLQTEPLSYNPIKAQLHLSQPCTYSVQSSSATHTSVTPSSTAELKPLVIVSQRSSPYLSDQAAKTKTAKNQISRQDPIIFELLQRIENLEQALFNQVPEK